MTELNYCVSFSDKTEIFLSFSLKRSNSYIARKIKETTREEKKTQPLISCATIDSQWLHRGRGEVNIILPREKTTFWKGRAVAARCQGRLARGSCPRCWIYCSWAAAVLLWDICHRQTERQTNRQAEGWCKTGGLADRVTDGHIDTRLEETGAERANSLL